MKHTWRRIRGFAGYWRCTRIDLAHDVVAALMVALFTLVLDHAQVLEWLDAGMLRIVGARHGQNAVVDPFPTLRPGIVDIDLKAYSEIFSERSPLDRVRVASLLSALEDPTVRVVAIDIDVSPTPADTPAAQASVDTALEQLGRKGRAVVLILPDPSAGDAKLAWVRARCLVPGIHFATPLVRERFGAVTLAETGVPTLSAVALALARSDAGGGALSTRVCGLARTADSDRALNDAARMLVAGDEAVPLHPDAISLRHLVPVTTGVVQPSAGVIRLEDRAVLRPVMFVGGDYDRADQFNTSDGRLPGLYVHAGTFTSLQTSTRRFDAWAGLGFDVLSAIALGLFFAGVWRLYGHYEARWLRDRGGLWPPGRRTAISSVRIVVARLVGVGVWLLPIGLTFLAFRASQALLLASVWVNPGTLIIGMFLDARSTREEAGPAAHDDEYLRDDGFAPSFLRRLALSHPDTLVTQPLFIGVLVVVLAFQLLHR